MRRVVSHGAAVFALSVILSACAVPRADGSHGDAGAFALPAPLPDLTSFALVQAGPAPTAVPLEAAAEILATYDVVFVGEIHLHPGNHIAQMSLFRGIHGQAGNVTLSMEQFERDTQPILDDYLAGRIGESILTDRARAWGNYAASYRPLVEYAKEHGLPVIAANAPAQLIRCVGREGPSFLARIKPEQRALAAADIDLTDGAYKAKFMAFAGGDAGHGDAAGPGANEQALRSFAAQVTRDETMAESIAAHLARNPGRKVVHLTGHFHSDSFLGTVERLKRRLPHLRIAVVAPVAIETPERPKLSAEELARGTLILALRPLPGPYASKEEVRAAISRQRSARAATACGL